MTARPSAPLDGAVPRVVNRRTVLAGGAVLLGALLVEVRRPAGAHAAVPQGLVLEPLSEDVVEVVSARPSTVTQYPRRLGVRILNHGDELPAGTTFDLEYDQRIYSALDAPVVLLAGSPAAGVSASVPVTDEATGVTRQTVTVEVPVGRTAEPAQALEIVVATARPPAYPDDLLRAPGPAEAVLPAAAGARARGGGGRRRERQSDAPVRTDGLPWGVELAVSWGVVTWGGSGALSYPAPARVRVRSVGPGPTPKGMRLSARLDARVVSDVAAGEVPLDEQPAGRSLRRLDRRADTVVEVQWQLPRALAPDDVLDLDLSVTATPPEGNLDGVLHPVVWVSAPPRDSTQQRVTGATSATRRDAAWTDDPAEQMA